MGALLSISVPTGGLGVVELPAPEVTLDPVLYHDDVFVALRADCIENLVPTVQEAVACVELDYA
eukprot:2146488-Amphidinium_carterae.1